MKALKHKQGSDERGFAAIVIAIVLVIILSLITVGFAQLMRSEQRSALDKQLSSQAYYAAESGVNVAAKAIDDGYTGTKTSCTSDGSALQQHYFGTNTVGTNTKASFPCLLIDPTPRTLEFTIPVNASKTFEMEGIVPSTGNPSPIDTIVISWQDTNDQKSKPGDFMNNCSNWPPANTYSGTGALRAELINAGDLSRIALVNNQSVGFLCPSKRGGNDTWDYNSNRGVNSGAVFDGDCKANATPRYCNVKLSGLGGLNQTTFFLNLSSIYNTTHVTISAYKSGALIGGNQLKIGEAQTLVDSTGKAQDVLRRVQVRISTHDSPNLPDGTQAMSALCKQLDIGPGFNHGPGCN